MSSLIFGAGKFTEGELERSAPLDPQRRLNGETGAAVLAELWSRLEPDLGRRRGSRDVDGAQYLDALDVLLANLAAAAFNRVDPLRFVTVAFSGAAYAGLTIRHTAMQQIRDGLAELGLVEGQAGYRRYEAGGVVAQARRTRLRAAPPLRALFQSRGLSRVHIDWRGHRDVIRMRAPDPHLPPEPLDVRSSRALLEAVNARIAATDLWLPDEGWRRIAARYRRAPETAEEEDRPQAGDLTATFLHRGFKGGWDRGGRLYGGWWINLPAAERTNLTIHGAPVSEVDFARLHPTLLYARVGARLDFDPYMVPGAEGPRVRELGKRTFNRLLNRTPPDGRRDVRLGPTLEDVGQLPPGWSFSRYLARFVERLDPIATWFGSGEGLRLQREDSDLALAVLERLLDAGVVALPVHDSFIARRQDETMLRLAMISAFKARYGFEPLMH